MRQHPRGRRRAGADVAPYAMILTTTASRSSIERIAKDRHATCLQPSRYAGQPSRYFVQIVSYRLSRAPGGDVAGSDGFFRSARDFTTHGRPVECQEDSRLRRCCIPTSLLEGKGARRGAPRIVKPPY